MIIKCTKCGVEEQAENFKHSVECEVPDLIQLLVNLDDVVSVFGREKLEAYRLLNSIDKMYEILHRRIGQNELGASTK